MLLGILLAAIIVVCIALVGVILLQRSEGGVLGMSGGGGPGNFMSARGTGDLLTRTTQILAGLFFGLCLIMTLLTGHLRRESVITSQLKNLSIAPPSTSSQAPAAPTQTAPAPLTPIAPAPAPSNSGGGLNLFGNASTTAPVAPHVQPAPAATPKLAAAKPVSVKPVSVKPARAPAVVKPAESAPAPAATPAAPAAEAPAAPTPPPAGQ
jgi:preprotein translocase subunit SecG